MLCFTWEKSITLQMSITRTSDEEFFRLCVIALLGAGLFVNVAHAQSTDRYHSIRPGQLWLDTNGKPIHAHGFQTFVGDDGQFYWYGENKEHTHLGSNVWTWGVRAYRSSDFYNWEDMGLIIEPDTVNPLSPLHYSQTLDRPHILYNKCTRKWVCWIKSMDTDGFFVVLQTDKFEGPYQLVRQFKPEGFGVGDFDMYVDPETGKGYVWFERPHWELICAELTEDFLSTNGTYSEHFVGIRPPFTREALAHFVYQGRHYMFTSGTTGYVPNPSQVCVFDDYHGEYTDLGCPHINDKLDDSFGSQITSVIQIGNTYVALADRWLPHLYGTDIPKRTIKNKEKAYLNHKPFDRDFSVPKVKDKTGVKRNKWDTTDSARYVFLPVTFDVNGKPVIEWHDEWTLPTPLPAREGQGGGSAVFLPKSIAPINCRNVLIEGITIDQGLYWNVVPQYCENVIIRGVTVNSYGHGRTDGIDIESSRNVLVEYCQLDCQDDCYTMKSGRNEDGLRVNRPTENVVLRNNLALRGAGGIVCGTELAGGVHNIYLHDCVFNGTDQAFRFKTLRKRGGGVSNVTVERVRANVTGPAFYCDMLGSVKWGGDLARRYGKEGKETATEEEIAALLTPYTPDFHDITIRDVVVEHCGKFISAIGLPERPLRHVLIQNAQVTAKELGVMRDVEDFRLESVQMEQKGK